MKDVKNARFIENLISQNDMRAFVCENTADLKKFLEEVRECWPTGTSQSTLARYGPNILQPTSVDDRPTVCRLFGRRPIVDRPSVIVRGRHEIDAPSVVLPLTPVVGWLTVRHALVQQAMFGRWSRAFSIWETKWLARHYILQERPTHILPGLLFRHTLAHFVLRVTNVVLFLLFGAGEGPAGPESERCGPAARVIVLLQATAHPGSSAVSQLFHIHEFHHFNGISLPCEAHGEVGPCTYCQLFFL